MNRIFEKIQQKIDTMVASHHFDNEQDMVRLNHYIWLCMIVIPVGIFPIIYNLHNQSYLIATLVIFLVIFLITTLFMLKNIENIYALYFISSFIYWFIILFIVYFSDGDNSKILWAYTYPLGVVFLFGNRVGIAWSISLVLGIFFLFSVSPELSDTYSVMFKIRFFLTYLATCAITIWFEYHRNRYMQESLDIHHQLREISQKDTLTGIYNRRSFWDLAEKEIQKAQRHDTTLSLAILDVDNFKYINDTYGHPTGDNVLIALSEHCQKTLRRSDIFARIGGEEFAFLLLHVDQENALLKMNALRKELENIIVMHDNTSISFTVSIGVSTLDETLNTLELLYNDADKRLYFAKNQGRNCVR